MVAEKKIIISLPKELADKLEKKIEQTDFDSLSAYIIYILEQVIPNKENDSEQVYSQEEEEKLKKELKKLGYL